MQIITSGDHFLLSNMSHLRLQSCHRETRCKVNTAKNKLVCTRKDKKIYYHLRPTLRGDFHIEQADFSDSSIEEPIWVETYGIKLCLYSPNIITLEKQSDPSL